MKRLGGVLGTLVLSFGCTVESDDPPMQQTSGRICSAVLTTTGTFAPDTAHPRTDGEEGCWPYGTWTFTASVGESDCSPAPQPLPEYTVGVNYVLDENGDPAQEYEYLTEPTIRHTVKVGQGGAGVCYVELLTFSDDGTELWLLKPSLFAENNVLMGDGEFSIYSDDQWDEPAEP